MLIARALAERTAGIDAADVDAPQKRDLAVDHEQLAVIALIDVPTLLEIERNHRVEFEQIDAAVAVPLEKFARRAEGADAVVDEIDLFALRLLLDQGIGDTPAHLVGVEDIGLHVDVILGRPDGREHRFKGLRPIFEQGHLVAHHQRAAADGLFEREVADDEVGRLTAVAEALKDLLALLRRKRTARPRELYRLMRTARHVGDDGRQRGATAHYDLQQDPSVGDMRVFEPPHVPIALAPAPREVRGKNTRHDDASAALFFY